MFTESFTSMLFKSVLISTWLFMESEFKGYCNAMQCALSMDLSYSDLKGSAIDRFRNYTLKVLKLDLRLNDENWQDLKAINEIRNIQKMIAVTVLKILYFSKSNNKRGNTF